MRKRILLMLAIFSFVGSSLMAQTVEGGAGIVFVDVDPNGITALEDVTVNEANIAYNRTTQIMYVFDPTGTAGIDQWIAVDVTSAVTSVTGSGDITVTQTGTVYDVGFSETHTTLTWNATTNQLTYTSEDGAPTVIDLSDAVDFEDSANINVLGSGTTASPYSFIIDGSDTATAGEVPTSDGAGGVTWGQVIQSATFTATGELELTLTDGVTKVLVNMESIPKVVDATALAAAAAAVDATSGGVARADVNNTFGMPATSTYGVLFFISN